MKRYIIYGLSLIMFSAAPAFAQDEADEDAPSAKSSADVLKGLFEKVLPEYDRERFYVSHMKKVVEWYNFIKKYASFDFVNPQEQNTSEETAETDKE